MTFTGNTLGLSKLNDQNMAGTSDSIGGFKTGLGPGFKLILVFRILR